MINCDNVITLRQLIVDALVKIDKIDTVVELEEPNEIGIVYGNDNYFITIDQ